MLQLLKRVSLKRLYSNLPVGKLTGFACDLSDLVSQSRVLNGPTHPSTRALEFQLSCINGALSAKLRR